MRPAPHCTTGAAHEPDPRTETTNPSAEQQAQLQRTVAVLNGGIPAVFFNGMGKANPTLDEVVAQVRAPR